MSKLTGKLGIGALFVVAVVLSLAAGASLAPGRQNTITSTVTFTRTVTPGPPPITAKGQRVKINETFTVLCGRSGEPKVPVQITFLRAFYADKAGGVRADKGYKYLIVDVSVKNVGNRETYVFEIYTLNRWTLKVDKGYIYDSEGLYYLPQSVRPEEVKTGYVYFEILAETRAVEVYGRVYWADVEFILEV